LEIGDAEFQKVAFSWHATRNALTGAIEYCGQDETALRYLHLPKNLENVNFNLNLSHPDDDFKFSYYGGHDNFLDFFAWVKEFGQQNDKYSPQYNLSRPVLINYNL